MLPGAIEGLAGDASRKALLVLGFYKHEGFLGANLNRILGFEIIPDLEAFPKIVLPVGSKY